MQGENRDSGRTRVRVKVRTKDFNSYNALTIIIFCPHLDPNSGPATVQIFSLHGAVKYAFCMSRDSMLSPLSAAIVKAILTLSLDTTDEYVKDEGDSVI